MEEGSFVFRVEDNFNSVLFISHPNVFPLLFKIPSSVVLKVEKLQRDFLWSRFGGGKRDHLVIWDIVCRTKEFGGLGLGKTSLRKRAL